MEATTVASIMSKLDLQSPFVSVVVDSDRVNATLKLMAAAISSLQGALDGVTVRLSQTESVNKLVKQELEDQKAKTTSLERAFDAFQALEAKVSALERTVDDRFAVVGEDQKAIKLRVDGFDAKLTTLVKQRADDQAALAKVIQDAGRANSDALAAVNSLTSRVDDIDMRVSEALRGATSTLKDLKTVVEVFDIDLPAAAAAVAASAGQGRGAHGDDALPTVDYVLALPSFVAIRERVSKIVLEETTVLRLGLSDKLDSKIFYKSESRIEDCAKAAKAATQMAERVSADVQSKVDRTDFKASIERLASSKADAAALMSLASQDELQILRGQMAQLREDIEKHLSQQQLESREARIRLANAGGGGAGNATQLQQQGDQLADLLARVSELEKITVGLEERKADRSELVALHQFVEDSLANFSVRRERPASGGGRRTPTNDPLLATPQRRLLSPITRPSSASIPEAYRPPHEPLYYTSLAPTRPDSPASSRLGGGDHSTASTQVYDANGNRTSATLSQGKPVPAAEHYENMRRVVSGETVIPAGFVLHHIPSD